MTAAPTQCRDINAQLKAAVHALPLAQRPSSGVVSFTMPIPSLDVVDWISAQPHFPKVFWQARDEQSCYAGVGAAVLFDAEQNDAALWTEMTAFTQKAPDAVLFGGMRFDAQRLPGPEWHDFGHAAFFLPQFLIKQEGDATTLRCSIGVADDLPREDWLCQVDRQIDLLQFEAPPLDDDAHTIHGVPQDMQDRAEWMASVDELTKLVASDMIEKVVLVRRTDVTFPKPPTPFTFIRRFRAMKSSAYFFCFQFSRASAFIGSSPECFFMRSGREVMGEALAGTRPRGQTTEEDRALKALLLDSPKDRHEHKLVQDHVRKALRPLCSTLASDAAPAVYQLVLVQHLLQTTRGSLKPGVSDWQLLSALHPTPAVGGVPPDTALDLIRKLEPFDRGWYAAPVGMISRDHVTLAVGIRSGLLHNRTLSLYCGAGIVASSDPDSEWEETEAKLANFLHVVHVE